ncbi:MAG: HIT family protein [Verrucomicrobiales bacterium]|nr:HIT family protein [Verrucomicrobiales bacterium]
MPDYFIAKAGLATRIVAQTDNFLALPSVSPLARGHLLILPRSHIPSMTQLASEKFDEFLAFAREHCRRIEERLGSVLVFEHGVGRGEAGGCGVDHAHLHILPLSPSSAERVRTVVNAGYPLRSPASFDLVRRNVPNGRSYLTLGTSIDQLSHAMSEAFRPSIYAQ